MCCTAECISDTLAGGGGGLLGDKTPAIDAKYGARVTAAVMVCILFLPSFLPSPYLTPPSLNPNSPHLSKPQLTNQPPSKHQMGDPRYMITQTAFHVGTCFQNGLFPRTSDQSLSGYSSILKSYCDYGDPFCCSGLDVLEHLNYVAKYNSLALAFVLSKI